jgi:hypothetical protein
MKRQFFIALVITFAVLSSLLGTMTAGAQDIPAELRAEITSYVIMNVDGSDVTDDNLMAGNSYIVTFELDIGVDLGNNTLLLSTGLDKYGDVYWHLDNEYEGVNTDEWQPGKSTIEFDIVKGTAQFTLEGTVPIDYVSQRIPRTGAVIHLPADITVIKLVLGPSGTQLTESSSKVIDQAIDTYEKVLIIKETALDKAITQPNAADPQYTALSLDIVARAKELAAVNGYVEEATDLLNTLPESSSDYPIPVEEGSYTIYIIIIAILAVIIVAVLALFFHARSNSSFLRQQVDEEAGRLDVLSVRTTKIDKQLARDLEQVKEQLERISGR